jgi:hypothetical protein
MAADLIALLGRSPDSLTLQERKHIAGKWVALEVYSPRTLPLRRIEAVGDSVADCMRMLRQRGQEPTQFEYQRLL